MSDPTYEALLLAVLADPAGDVPRLILADFLDERGDPDRGAFIRVQCDLTRKADYCHPVGPGRQVCRPCNELYALHRRERELWGSYPDEDDVRSRFHAEMPPGVEWCILPESLGRNLNPPFASVRRGFVAEVRCSLADWLEHGPAVVRRQPVERVETDFRPYRADSNGKVVYAWCEAGCDHGRDAVGLPAPIYRLLPAGRPSMPGGVYGFLWYGSLEVALDALSDALLLYARRQAFPCRACGTKGHVTPDDGWGARDKCPACGGRGWKIGG